MAHKLTQEEAKAAAIIIGAIFVIILISVFSSKIIKVIETLFGKSDEDKQYNKDELERIKSELEKQKREAEESAKKQPTSIPSSHFAAAAKTIEDNLAFDTATYLNRDVDKADLAFTSAINSDSDFDALVAAYGIRPYKTLFGKKTDVKVGLLALMKSTFGDWRIKRTNEILASKKVTRRV